MGDVDKSRGILTEAFKANLDSEQYGCPPSSWNGKQERLSVLECCWRGLLELAGLKSGWWRSDWNISRAGNETSASNMMNDLPLLDDNVNA